VICRQTAASDRPRPWWTFRRFGLSECSWATARSPTRSRKISEIGGPAHGRLSLHEQPDLFEHETQIIDSRPGAVRLARSALHPGGGGQESDRAILEYGGGQCRIIDVRDEDGLYWHMLDSEALVPTGAARVKVDAVDGPSSLSCIRPRTS